MAYKPTIGLEIHAELKTASKMFCGCKNDPDEKRPNVNICPVCTAQPGTLPVANEEAIKKVIKAGLALNCTIAKDSKFDRKNYFYPDIPKGYQISQYDQPFCQKGYLEIEAPASSAKASAGRRKIGITRIHLEEDTGKSIHPEGADYSLVDFNRAGMPLMELVTEPDITSGAEASAFAQELQMILKYLGVSDADMEKGLMRVEVNISVSKTKKFGTKVEIKNLNSFKVVEKAIDFEIARQIELLEKGDPSNPSGQGKVVQETRGWHDKKEITFSQREKESAHDYRYFPEPDLPPLHFEKKYIDEIKASIPELPAEKRKRFAKEYALEVAQVGMFVANKELGNYFEAVASEFDEWMSAEKIPHGKDLYKLVANYLITDIKGLLGSAEFQEKQFKITPENFAQFIKMIYKGEISSKVAKMVLAEMFGTGVDPANIVKANNWGQMQDDGSLEKVIAEIIAKNPKAVTDYKGGNKNVLQFLAGQTMAATRGTANPQKVRELLEKALT